MTTLRLHLLLLVLHNNQKLNEKHKLSVQVLYWLALMGTIHNVAKKILDLEFVEMAEITLDDPPPHLPQVIPLSRLGRPQPDGPKPRTLLPGTPPLSRVERDQTLGSGTDFLVPKTLSDHYSLLSLTIRPFKLTQWPRRGPLITSHETQCVSSKGCQ